MNPSQLITGAAGFIGTHLRDAIAGGGQASATTALDLRRAGDGAIPCHVADIRDPASLAVVSGGAPVPVQLHLAAVAEAVIPFAALEELVDTNVHGTLNVLRAFDPERMVFASSSAVYGTLRARRARPVAEDAAPCGAYGVSKLMGEAICRQWAADRGRSAVLLRLGNVVGPGCRGLIPYLVAHAVRHPDGAVPARLRGEGRIVRDYVPVDVVVRALEAAARLPVPPGEVRVFNVGSATGMTNGEVARRVASVLERRGLRLAMTFDDPVGLGESEAVVLDVEDTARTLGIAPPTSDAVARSIEEAAGSYLDSPRAPRP